MSYYHNYGNSLDNSNRLHDTCHDDDYNDDLDGFEVSSQIDQSSNELIVVRDSLDVTVTMTDTKFALTLQAALQAAIIAVSSIAIGNNDNAENVTTELLEFARIKQATNKKVVVANSRSVDVITINTDIAVSLQILIQILAILFVLLEIL